MKSLFKLIGLTSLPLYLLPLKTLSLLLGSCIMLTDARMLVFKVCISTVVHGPRFMWAITVIITHD